MSRDERIAEAERAIAEILRDLEADTGDLVEQVELVRFAATRLDDERPRHLIAVRINLLRLPAHDWAC